MKNDSWWRFNTVMLGYFSGVFGFMANNDISLLIPSGALFISSFMSSFMIKEGGGK